MTYVNGEARLPIAEPEFEDYELAIRALSGAPLRPGESERYDSDPAVLEARHRVEHCMRSQVAAARASLIALGPKATQALSDLLDSGKEEIRLGAVRLWSGLALPPEPVQVAHTHSLDQGDRQLVAKAAEDFSRLTNELSARITGYQTIDIEQSPHLLRGDAARPVTTRLEKREADRAPR